MPRSRQPSVPRQRIAKRAAAVEASSKLNTNRKRIAKRKNRAVKTAVTPAVKTAALSKDKTKTSTTASENTPDEAEKRTETADVLSVEEEPVVSGLIEEEGEENPEEREENPEEGEENPEEGEENPEEEEEEEMEIAEPSQKPSDAKSKRRASKYTLKQSFLRRVRKEITNANTGKTAICKAHWNRLVNAQRERTNFDLEHNFFISQDARKSIACIMEARMITILEAAYIAQIEAKTPSELVNLSESSAYSRLNLKFVKIAKRLIDRELGAPESTTKLFAYKEKYTGGVRYESDSHLCGTES